MKYLIVAAWLSVTGTALAQNETPLLGICTPGALQAGPYASWYNPGYEHYHPNARVVDQLKKSKLEKTVIKIVFGSWCGDSKREVPRMLKTLHVAGFSEKNIQLIGVSSDTDVYKQAPNREEKDLHVYRVPTFIVYQNDREVGRINEYPAESLERDLQKIISGQPYTPSYRGFPYVNTWLAQGLLADENTSPRGLADQIRSDVHSESELNACGYVLLARGDVKEAITVFRINVHLYPQSSNCFDSLGEAYAKAGLHDNALFCYEQAVALNPENENARTQVAKLKAGK